MVHTFVDTNEQTRHLFEDADAEQQAYTTDTPTGRFVVRSLGYDPDDLFPVPAPDDFTMLSVNDEGEEITVEREWLASEELASIGAALIERHADTLHHLKPFKIAYYWQKKGGLENGRYRYGATLRPGGLLRELTDADFIVWLAADYTHEFYEAWRIEAALFHQLLHTTTNQTTGGPKLRPHQFEGFGAEITHYGLWNAPLKIAGKAAQQLPLFDENGGSE